MTIIDNNTVVVFSSSELKEALEKDNGYTYVYFGSDITLTAGIKIASSKLNVTIDGMYDGVIHKFEDVKTLNAGDTISVNTTMNKVVVRNMNVTGYNYYGIIYVPDSASYKNVIVEYNNITYVGPQICFHPYGLTRFIDSNVTISDATTTSGGEVAECNKIEIGGNTTITHNSKGNSAFWFRNTEPELTILSLANVTFVSQYRELFYGPNNLAFSVLSGASFKITSYNGMAYGSFGTLNTIIAQGASLEIKQTNRNGSYPTWYSYGSITLENNSSLIMINDYANITSSNYNISFASSTAGFYLNNPKKVVLYNSVANVIRTTATIPFKFQFTRINLFDAAIPIEQDASYLPTYAWYKENDISIISGTFSSTTTKIESNNFTEEEIKALPLLTNFIFPNKKILSIGKIPFRVNALTDKDTIMRGITLPKASILIKYDDVSKIVTSDDDGNFTYTYDSPLSIGTLITFNTKEYNDLLYNTKSIEIVYSGELTIDSASSLISFKLEPISTKPLLCPRKNDVSVIVTDSRVNSTAFKLYAAINHDLTSSSGVTLKDALVYVNEVGDIKSLSTTPVLVYTGTPNEGVIKVTNVTWKDNEGILLNVTEPLINNLEYTATITWSIEE